MSLPLPWVDRIFEKLTLVYGQAFLARWRDVDLMAVKSDWAHELAGFAPKEGESGAACVGARAIAYALANLDPAAPPTVLQFRTLARRAPVPDVPRLPEPKADPERVAAELAKLAPIVATVRAASPVDHKAWAKRLMARVGEGDRLNPTVLRMAKAALGLADDTPRREVAHA